MIFHLPRLFIPNDPDVQRHVKYAYQKDSEIADHIHPWQTCPVCSYVLCSCGNCHSEECGEVCLHELSA